MIISESPVGLFKLQPDFVSLCFTVLRFTDGGSFKNVKHDTPPAKRLQPTLFPHSLYCSGLEPNRQYSRGIPVL